MRRRCGAAAAAAGEADSDAPTTEMATAPPKTSDPARSARQYFANSSHRTEPSALGLPWRTRRHLPTRGASRARHGASGWLDCGLELVDLGYPASKAVAPADVRCLVQPGSGFRIQGSAPAVSGLAQGKKRGRPVIRPAEGGRGSERGPQVVFGLLVAAEQ